MALFALTSLNFTQTCYNNRYIYQTFPKILDLVDQMQGHHDLSPFFDIIQLLLNWCYQKAIFYGVILKLLNCSLNWLLFHISTVEDKKLIKKFTFDFQFKKKISLKFKSGAFMAILFTKPPQSHVFVVKKRIVSYCSRTKL